GSIACLSVLSILSYNVLEEYTLDGKNFNDVMDYFSNQILLPLGGLLIAVFAGWVIKKEYAKDELTTLGDTSFEIWHFLIRYIVPPAVLVILIGGVVA
ncbi:MAG: NSS family neurotransmitter:Na+ symporter, partial [Halioglobus sp.]